MVVYICLCDYLLYYVLIQCVYRLKGCVRGRGGWGHCGTAMLRGT